METWQKEVGFITPPGSGIVMPEFLAIRPAGVGFLGSSQSKKGLTV